MRIGKLETEPGKKRFDEAIVAATRQRLRLGLKFFPPLLDLNLQLDEFVQRQPLARNFHVSQFFREMNHVDGVRPGWEMSAGHAVLCAPLRGFGRRRARSEAPCLLCRPRLGDVPLDFFQRAPDQPAQPALRQALGERIHRCDAVEVDETFLAAFDDFGFGMGHHARFGFAQFAIDKNLVAHRKIFFHERQVPPAAMQPSRPIVEDDFKNGFAAAAKTPEAGRDDRAARRGGFVLRQFGNFMEVPAVFVTPGPVQQQILDGVNVEARELRRAFAANAPQRGHRSSQRRRCFAPAGRRLERRDFGFRRRHRPHDTNRRGPLQRESNVGVQALACWGHAES